jgi:intracellular sulfur oxidation DsrE/DsrF family protein
MRYTNLYALLLCAVTIHPAIATTPTETSTQTTSNDQMIKVNPHANYKVVYDIHSEEIAAGIHKGLYYARGLIEAYEKQGVTPQQLSIHLVMHGDAAKFLLVDDTYQRAIKDAFSTNNNAKIVQDLIHLGVHVEICHSTMKAMGWTAKDILPGVTMVHDGYTRLIALQNQGYAYIGGF